MIIIDEPTEEEKERGSKWFLDFEKLFNELEVDPEYDAQIDKLNKTVMLCLFKRVDQLVEVGFTKEQAERLLDVYVEMLDQNNTALKLDLNIMWVKGKR